VPEPDESNEQKALLANGEQGFFHAPES